jgi:hypothetical protein
MKHADVILPSQHLAAPKKVAPEYRLMIAVLENAITCITKYRSATDTRGRRLFDEEQRWLCSEDTHSPYAFVCICDVLDLDVDTVRRRLGLIAAAQPVSLQHEMPIATSPFALGTLQAALAGCKQTQRSGQAE